VTTRRRTWTAHLERFRSGAEQNAFEAGQILAESAHKIIHVRSIIRKDPDHALTLLAEALSEINEARTLAATIQLHMVRARIGND
jgi:hypothetical protein